MRTAEEIINEHPTYYILPQEHQDIMVFDFYMVRHLINKARKEAIEECAKRATVTEKSLNQTYPSPSGHIRFKSSTVNKKSILSLINKLK